MPRHWPNEMTILLLDDNLGCHRRAREPISNFTPFNCYLSEIERPEFYVANEDRQTKPNQTKLCACSLEKFYLSFVQYNRITFHLEKTHTRTCMQEIFRCTIDTETDQMKFCSYCHFHFHLEFELHLHPHCFTIHAIYIWPMQMLHMFNEILIIPWHKTTRMYFICIYRQSE